MITINLVFGLGLSVVIGIVILIVYSFISQITEIDEKLSKVVTLINRIHFCDICGNLTNDYTHRYIDIPSSVCAYCYEHILTELDRKRLWASRVGHGAPDEDPLQYRKGMYFTKKGMTSLDLGFSPGDGDFLDKMEEKKKQEKKITPEM